jgi:hypothetical protein
VSTVLSSNLAIDDLPLKISDNIIASTLDSDPQSRFTVIVAV